MDHVGRRRARCRPRPRGIHALEPSPDPATRPSRRRRPPRRRFCVSGGARRREHGGCHGSAAVALGFCDAEPQPDTESHPAALDPDLLRPWLRPWPRDVAVRCPRKGRRGPDGRHDPHPLLREDDPRDGQHLDQGPCPAHQRVRAHLVRPRPGDRPPRWLHGRRRGGHVAGGGLGNARPRDGADSRLVAPDRRVGRHRPQEGRDHEQRPDPARRFGNPPAGLVRAGQL